MPNVERPRQKIPAKLVRKELLPEQSTALLQALHILTNTGELNADARRKLKQINHLAQCLTPGLEALFAASEQPVVVDAGAGNAYLGFVLYELWFGRQGRGEVWNVEVRPDLVARSQQRATQLGYDRMRFLQRPVVELVPPTGELTVDGRRIDAVVALHACDTATDDALALGIRAEAPLIAVVPCCQAEVARLLDGGSAVRSPIGALWRHPMHRREFGAHLTNVIRGLVLEAHGYQVTVTELTGWEHSLKNELILARKVQRRNGLAIRQLQSLLAELPALDMQLLRLPGLPVLATDPLPSGENEEIPGAVAGTD